MNPSQSTLDNKLITLETLVGVSEYAIKSKLEELRDSDTKEEPC